MSEMSPDPTPFTREGKAPFIGMEGEAQVIGMEGEAQFTMKEGEVQVIVMEGEAPSSQKGVVLWLPDLDKMVQWITGTEAAQDSGAGTLWVTGPEETFPWVEGWEWAPPGTTPTLKHSPKDDVIPLKIAKGRACDPVV